MEHNEDVCRDCGVESEEMEIYDGLCGECEADQAEAEWYANCEKQEAIYRSEIVYFDD